MSTLRPSIRAVIGLTALTCSLTSPAFAQQISLDRSAKGNATDQNEGIDEIGRTTETGVGEVGQRQSIEDVAPNFTPLQRIETRINIRLQNRLRNRIDREYSAEAASSYEDAHNQIYDAGRRARTR